MTLRARDASEAYIGLVIKSRRMARGYTCTDLGAIVGLSAQAIDAYEKGHRQPSLDRLESLASALGVEASELLRQREADRRAEGDNVSEEHAERDVNHVAGAEEPVEIPVGDVKVHCHCGGLLAEVHLDGPWLTFPEVIRRHPLHDDHYTQRGINDMNDFETTGCLKCGCRYQEADVIARARLRQNRSAALTAKMPTKGATRGQSCQ